MKPVVKLKIHKFLKKYGRLIAIVLIILFAIYIVNRLVGYFRNRNMVPETSYTPDITVLSSEKVPTKVNKSMEDFIREYVEYCNSGEYEKAYNMLSKDCKENYFTSLENFADYVKNKFYSKRNYSIQSYSKYNGKYIYSLKLFDDVLATGLTNSTYRYQEEKIVASYDANNKIVFCAGNFIETKDVKSVQENEYLKADVKMKSVNYSSETYTVKLTNRSDYTVVIQDGYAGETEVSLDLGQELRDNQEINDIVLRPREATEVTLSFIKYYDDGDTSKSIILNNVRVMENYTGNEQTAEEEIKNALNKFSMTIGVK